MTKPAFEARGVIPACLLPFDHDLAIDAAAFRSHLRDVSRVDGISAVTVNAHSTEVATCTPDEQREVMDIALDTLGDQLPIVHGIYADGSHLAASIARRAEHAGASALLIFPSATFAMGGMLRPEMALAHFKTIASVTDLPMIAFQYPAVSGIGYPIDTLLEICSAVPNICISAR